MKAELNWFLEKYIVYPDGKIWSKASRKYLKHDESSSYARVTLSKNGIKKRELVHRIIAFVYVPNPQSKPCVNHKDGDKLNNDYRNLEWCTYSENESHSRRVLGKQIKHSESTKRKIGASNRGKKRSEEFKKHLSNALKGRDVQNKRAVVLNGSKVYGSITEAAKANNMSVGAICQNLKGLTKKTKVGTWEYK